MYYVYVLRSKKNSKQYIGFTGKTPEERLQEHNNGANTFTKNNRPFELIYFEKYEDKSFAQKREIFLKSGNGREFLKKKLTQIFE
jgi:putative endonuclease